MHPPSMRNVLLNALFIAAVSAAVFLCSAPLDAANHLEKVTVVQSNSAVAFLPTYVALWNGYWREDGLDVDLVITRGGGECLTAVLSGDAVACASASPTMLQAWSQGHTNLISVGSIINRFTLNGVVRKGFLAQRGIDEAEFLALPVFERIRLMRGATFGISGPGAISDTFPRWLVRTAGLDPDRDITIAPLGGGGPMYTALVAGRIDAFFLSPPLTVQAITDGHAITLVDNLRGELEGFTDFVYEVLVTRKQLIDERPELVQALVNGLRKANNFIADHADDAETLAHIARQYFPELSGAVLEESVLAVAAGVPREARQTQEGWQAVLNFLEVSGEGTGAALDAQEGLFWTSRFTR